MIAHGLLFPFAKLLKYIFPVQHTPPGPRTRTNTLPGPLTGLYSKFLSHQFQAVTVATIG
jgi:hypothetical protein